MTKSNIVVACEWVDWCRSREPLAKARDSGSNINVSWSGTVFYSRSTPVATYNPGPGGPYVLICSKKYSPSTSGQLTRLGMALTSRDVPSFRVPYIGVTGGWSREPAGLAFKDVLAFDSMWLRNQIYECCDLMVKRWRFNDPTEIQHIWWPTQVETMCVGLERWHRLTGTRDEKPINSELLVRATHQRFQQKLDVYNSPREVKKRERASAKRVAMEALGLRRP